MKQQIENIIDKKHNELFQIDFNLDYNTKLNLQRAILNSLADEVLKITKCDCCDEKDEHIFKDDRSTTRISRPCSGCGKHQTIAGALLKSKEWQEWYKYASENILFDVDETLTVDAMSDEHWNSFVKFLNDKVLRVVVEKIEKLPVEVIGVKVDFRNPKLNSNGIICIRKDTILQLLSNLYPNK